MKNIAIQCLLRPALTVVDRCLDYDNFRATIDRIDRLLIDSEVTCTGFVGHGILLYSLFID